MLAFAATPGQANPALIDSALVFRAPLVDAGTAFRANAFRLKALARLCFFVFNNTSSASGALLRDSGHLPGLEGHFNVRLFLDPGWVVWHFANMKKYVLSAGLALMFCAPALRASLIWDWTYTSNIHAGSGTLTAETNTTTVFVFTGYQILSISGLWDGDPITGLMPSGLGNDNLLLLGLQKGGLLQSVPQQLDVSGMSFSTAADTVNIYSTLSGEYVATSDGAIDHGGSFSAELATPEPATSALVGSTLLLVALILRHRKRVHEERDSQALKH